MVRGGRDDAGSFDFALSNIPTSGNLGQKWGTRFDRRYFVITPQATRSPAFPAGSVL